MTTTDTRAAIHAAIRDLFLGSSTPAVARASIDAAITAHVEAEVTRRLACAPGVGEAIFAIEVASQTDADLGALAKDGVMACPTCDHERLPREDAERLIDAFALASSTRQKRAARNHDGRDDWDREATARAALLRALGVEA